MALTVVDQGLLGTNAQYTGFKNRIINGAMVIDQRNAGASISMASGDGGYCLDRWRTQRQGSGTLSLQQVSTAPSGFSSSLKVAVTGTSTPSAGDFYTIGQVIEGYNFADMAWGTATNQPITVSFWVQSSVTGTYVASVYNYGVGAYTYPATFTVNAANTWEQKTVTVNGATSAASGTWATGNTGSLYLRVDLGSGSSFNATANAWNATSGFRTSSSVSLVSNASATLYLTGVQLEKGSTATSFDYRPYGTELMLCQRYYQKYTQPPLRGVTNGSGIANRMAMVLPVVMRSAPSPTIGAVGLFDGSSITTIGSITVDYSTSTTVEYDFGLPTALNALRPCVVYQTGTASLQLSSEI